MSAMLVSTDIVKQQEKEAPHNFIASLHLGLFQFISFFFEGMGEMEYGSEQIAACVLGD